MGLKNYFCYISVGGQFFCLFAMILMFGMLGDSTLDAMKKQQSKMDTYWGVITNNEECTFAYEMVNHHWSINGDGPARARLKSITSKMITFASLNCFCTFCNCCTQGYWFVVQCVCIWLTFLIIVPAYFSKLSGLRNEFML